MQTISSTTIRPSLRKLRRTPVHAALAIAVCALLAFCAFTAQAQLPMAPHATASSPAGNATAAPALRPAPQARREGGGPHEGIKVHGHWVIEVRNPDGSLVSHSEFENSLSAGAISLSEILSKQFSAGFWSVILALSQSAQTGGEKPACTATTAVTSGASACLLTESQVSLTTGQLVNIVNLAGCTSTSNCSNTLQITYTNPSSASFTIGGSVTAAQAGYIDSVSTTLSACGGASGNGSVNYAACIAGTLPDTTEPIYIWLFSGTTLSTPVQVTAAGQILSVTVTFTFS